MTLPPEHQPDLVPGRDCGTCTACCKVFLIDEPPFYKDSGVLCVHAAGGGCGIYADRPKACRAFYCLWRHYALPEDFRPDRLGVVFWVRGMSDPQTVFDNVALIAATTGDEAVFDTPTFQGVVGQLSAGALPIFIRWANLQRMIHPRPALADAILNPQSTPHQRLVAEGRAWLERYAPLARQHAGTRTILPPGL